MRRRKGLTGKGRNAGRRSASSRKIASLKAAAAGGDRLRNVLAEVGNLYKPIKQPVTLRLDADVLAWFKKQGRGYQTRINRALRKLMLKDGGGAG
jgi:uncharacterized protein (DUF4415 family)